MRLHGESLEQEEWDYLRALFEAVLMCRGSKKLLIKWTKSLNQDVKGAFTFILCSGFGEDTLTATDTMLRASRPMHSEGVEDLSGEVSDW